MLRHCLRGRNGKAFSSVGSGITVTDLAWLGPPNRSLSIARVGDQRVVRSLPLDWEMLRMSCNVTSGVSNSLPFHRCELSRPAVYTQLSSSSLADIVLSHVVDMMAHYHHVDMHTYRTSIKTMCTPPIRLHLSEHLSNAANHARRKTRFAPSYIVPAPIT